MIGKSMPSGYDPMGGHRFSEKITPKKDWVRLPAHGRRRSTKFKLGPAETSRG